MAGAQTITAADYEQWLTPQDALKRLKYPDDIPAIEAIVRRMFTGEIRAAAKTAWLRARESHSYLLVDPFDLAKWQHRDSMNFWYGPGDMVFHQSDDGGYSQMPVPFPSYREVRLEPVGILAAPEVVEATKERWISALEAFGIVSRAYGKDELASETLLRELGAGLIASKCKRRTIRRSDTGAGPPAADNQDLDLEFWSAVSRGETRGDEDWQGGRFSATQLLGGDSHIVTAFGVVMAEADVTGLDVVQNAIRPPPPPPPPSLPPRSAFSSLAAWPPPAAGPPTSATEEPARTKPISKDKQAKFSLVLIETHGTEATEPFAHRAILAAYPEHKIPRDPFLTIFREIRGHKSRGRAKASKD